MALASSGRRSLVHIEAKLYRPAPRSRSPAEAWRRSELRETATELRRIRRCI
jgi:hypothetical protein